MAYTPKQLQYNTLKPVGFASKQKKTIFTPAAALNSYTYNDVIRFMIQTGGYWDPYNCYVKMTVQYDDSQQKGVALQLDSSAQSLIDQLLITSNSQEIERIEQYDTIACFLQDMNQTEDIKSTRLHEGINSGNRNNFNKPTFATTNQKVSLNSMPTLPQPSNSVSTTNTAAYKATYGTQVMANYNNWGLAWQSPDTNKVPGWFSSDIGIGTVTTTPNGPMETTAYFQTVQSNLYHPNKKRWLIPRLQPNALITNPAFNDTDSEFAWNYGNVNSKKAKYLNRYLGLLASQEPFCDKTLIAQGSGQIGPNGQVHQGSTLCEMNTQRRMYGLHAIGSAILPNDAEVKAPKYWHQKFDYEIGRCELDLILENYWQDIQGANGFAIDYSYLDEPDVVGFYNSSEANYLRPKFMGYQRSYCQALSTGFESYLSSTLPQICLYNGKIQDLPMPYSQKTYTFPLMSALFGVLLPRDSYRYIPMQYFQNLLFEFKMNPYAFFTSGNKVQQQTQDVLIAETPASRQYTILKMEIQVDVYYFDEVVDAQVNQVATSTGIHIHTASWFQGPQYPLKSTQEIVGTWQINMGFESLKILQFLILSNEYTSHSYCRKQFRLSQNITSLQLKFGTEYYPPQPITGHAGNPLGTITNSEFYQSLQKAYNKLNDIWGDMQINPINFAITERPYDPTTTSKFLSQAAAFTFNYQITGKTIGYSDQLLEYTLDNGSTHTAKGMPWFHENRCIGKALYALNLEGFPSDDKLISGLNTTALRPFEVLINADTANGTQRASTLMFFLYADIFYVIKAGGSVQLFGK